MDVVQLCLIHFPVPRQNNGKSALPVMHNYVMGRYDNSFAIISFIKLLLALVIALLVNKWWKYSGSGAIIESCSNASVDGCNSFCDDVAIVNVNVTDDDFAIDGDFLQPTVTQYPHVSVTSYCIAQLPGHCAYDYWLVFKLVPLLFHVVQFILQLLCLWRFRTFTPQGRQYDTIIGCWFPRAMQNLDLKLESHMNLNPSESRVRVANLRDIPTIMLRLMNPPIYGVFAFIEIFTVVWVWGELWYPPTFCGAVRPLSLYYYPIVMSLLDLIKLNMYVFAKFIKRAKYTESILWLFSLEILVVNSLITVALAVMFVVIMIYRCSSCVYVVFTFAIRLCMHQQSQPTTETTSHMLENVGTDAKATEMPIKNPIISSNGAENEIELENVNNSSSTTDQV